MPCPLKTESGEHLIRAFSELWLGLFPKPKFLLMDAAKSFVSERLHDFLSEVNIMPHYVAEEEAWAHGTIEADVQDVTRAASAIFLEARDMDPELVLHLAVLGFEHPSLLDPTFKNSSPVQLSLGLNLLSLLDVGAPSMESGGPRP